MSTYIWNIENINPNVIEPILGHTHLFIYITLHLSLFTLNLFPSYPSNLFKSDPLLSDDKKVDKKPINEFSWWDICYYIDINIFLPKYVSICEYT